MSNISKSIGGKLQYLVKAIGLVIFIVILLNVDYGLFYQTLKNINVLYLVLSFILLLPLMLIKAYRWLLIIKSIKLKGVTYLKCFYLYLIFLPTI